MMPAITSITTLLSIIFQCISIGCMIRFGVSSPEFGWTQLISFCWIGVALIGGYCKEGGNHETLNESEKHGTDNH